MSKEYLKIYAPGNLDPTDSYGLIACELARYLSREGFYVNVIPTGYRHSALHDDELAQIINQPIVPSVGGILLGYPTNYGMYGELANKSPKIALTMFESTKIPSGWRDALNNCDSVITPSNFSQEIFVDAGVRSEKIFVVPLGLNPIYKYKKRSLDLPFTFLAFLDRGKRKGGIYALEAFVEEFADDIRAHFIIKHKDIGSKTKLEILNKNIDVVYGDYSEQEMYDLFCRCHCLINPHKGEGFGLIPRQFAASGGISLTTNWSGTRDFLQFWGYPIDYTLEKADWTGIQKFEDQDLGEWAFPKKEDIKYKIRDVFENREDYLEDTLLKSTFSTQYYTWSNTAKMIAGIWRALDGNRGRS